MNISEKLKESKISLHKNLAEPLKKNAILLMLNTVFISGFGFIFWMIATRLYSPDDVGLGSATISAIGLISMIGALGFNISLIRFLPNEKRPNRIINTSLSLTGLFSLSLGIIFLFGIRVELWSSDLSYLTDNIVFMIFFLILIMFLTIKPLLNSIFLARRNATYNFIINSVIFSPLKAILIFLLSFMLSLGIWLSWGIALLVSISIGVFYCMPKLYKHYKFKFSIRTKYIRHMFHYSIGNYLSGIFGSLPGLFLPLVILELLSSRETAYFSITWMLASLLFTVPISISTSLFAEASIYESKFKANMKKALKFAGLLLLLGIVPLFIFSYEILSIGFGDEYATNGSHLLRIFVISAIPVCFNSMYTTIKRVEKKVKEILVMYSFIAFMTIGGGAIMLDVHGLNGIAYAWLISQTIVMSGSLIGIYRFFKK